jgi:hypothetical protein
MSSFPLFVMATIHGFAAGADNKNILVQWMALTGSLMILFLVLFRTMAPRRALKKATPAAVGRAAAA